MRERAQHLPYVVELAQAVPLGVEDAVVDEPEPLGFGVDIHARDHADAPDDALVVAAPLLAGHLDHGAKALVEPRIRSEARRVGIACVSTCRSWWSPDH